MNNLWEDKYNLVRVYASTRVGSDHNLVIVSMEHDPASPARYFRFDPLWLTQEGFKEWVISKWPLRFKENCLDHWHVISGKLRRSMKGWGVNFETSLRKHKQQILLTLDRMDQEGDLGGFSEQQWKSRYSLEKELQDIYTAEEIYWQKRGGVKWLLEGDSNIAFFHKSANGRKRKSTIHSLDEGENILTEAADLREHIIAYYKKLFGREETADIRLNNEIWLEHQLITPEENEMLTRPFIVEELDAAVKDMRNGTAPSLDGLSIKFFKEFWPQLRDDVKEMLDELHVGTLEVWKLNYGLIILIPKLKLPNNIKQFRPIYLLNIIYKIITKVLTLRLTPIASRVISRNQTTFIPGRNILDGMIVLHEVCTL